MRTVAVLQARLRSTRLPAKILLDLCGATVLQRCLDRVSRIEGVDEVVVASPSAPENDLIEMAVHRLGYRTVRGSETDVLARYLDAARMTKADVVIRLTSDCPLLDPHASSLVVRAFKESQQTSTPLHYASNTLERRLPRGLDTEVIAVSALERAALGATEEAEREHVTMHLYRRPAEFRCQNVAAHPTVDLSQLRWTLDTVEDYHFMVKVYAALGEKASTAGMDDVLQVLEAHPELRSINSHVTQKLTT